MTTVTTSTSAFYRKTQTQLRDLRSSAEKLEGQISTGERLTRSSDDPVAASRLRKLERDEALAQMHSYNADRAADDLGRADTALSSIADSIIRARELALWAKNGTLDETARLAVVEELSQIREQLLVVANSSDSSGKALFGGLSAQTAYVADASGAITYSGTGQGMALDLGEGQSVIRGVTGPEFLTFTHNGTETDLFALLAGMVSDLQAGSTNAVSDALSGLDNALDAVTRTQTVIGARLSWVDTVRDRQAEQSISRASETADVGGMDLATGIADLQQLLTVLEASQAGFTRLSGLTLFDKI